MKSSIAALSLFFAFGTPLVAQEAWVRETDLSTGLVYDIPLGPDGGMFTPPLPISEAGNTFELFARGTAWDTNVYLLDTKLIRAYAPVATLQVVSEDPYIRGDAGATRYVKRTRADRPYQVHVRTSGLVPGSPNPAENSVYYALHGCNYNPQTLSGIGQEQYLVEEGNLGNVDVTLGPIYHELNSPTATGACGEHIFTLVRHAADGVPDTVLAQPTLQVWPVASAEVENISAGQVFIDKIPSVVFHYKNTYPDSRTYVQIYPGPATLGTSGTVVTGSERRFGAHYNPELADSADVPQTVAITVDALSNYTSTDGIYTVEVLTETPFFGRTPERLAVLTFEVDRVISSRGKLSTSEAGTGTP